MNSHDLQRFDAVAARGSRTGAAVALHTVQSNVTACVATLERELGVRLPERHSRGVTPTSTGRVLLPHVAEVGRLLQEAARATGGSLPCGPLRVGSLETTAARRLPPVLLAFSAACPDVELTLETGTTAELAQAVLQRRLEGALIAGPAGHPALVEQPVIDEELVLISSPQCDGLTAALSGAQPPKLLVLRAGCSYR